MNNLLLTFLILLIICLVLVIVVIVHTPSMDQKDFDAMLSEDLDQDVDEYYNLKSRDPLEGCFFSLKMLAIAAIVYGVYHLIRYLV